MHELKMSIDADSNRRLAVVGVQVKRQTRMPDLLAPPRSPALVCSMLDHWM